MKVTSPDVTRIELEPDDSVDALYSQLENYLLDGQVAIVGGALIIIES